MVAQPVHMLALLGLVRDRPVHVLTVKSGSAEGAERTAEQACHLLRKHGVRDAHAIGLGDNEAGKPSETILGLASTLEVGFVALGAYGHRGIKELFGSCTREVLSRCKKPIFLHH